MEPVPNFADFFRALWGGDPFPWQGMLAERLKDGTWPTAIDLPTGTGKTACIDVAIYTLAAQAEKDVYERTAPRRIWFVVDRRIVVDETFDRAREIARRLAGATSGPLGAVAGRLRTISGTQRPLSVARLRGGILRDDGWARLPSQPAVITSTVDQLGSRLLFRGYGRSSQTAPIFAGLAAHDSLILLDEAHLSVPFMQTLRQVERYRGERWAEEPIRTPFAFTVLTATLPASVTKNDVFPSESQRDAALDDKELQRRIDASKPAVLVTVKTKESQGQDPLVEEAVKRAVHFVNADKQRVAVIVNRVRTAEAIARSLGAQSGKPFETVLLTGRLRPFERDRLVARWKPVLKANVPNDTEASVVLVTTQCIEVGADFSFDALVTEAASLDALRQRFGRLNRLGKAQDAPAIILIRDMDAKGSDKDPIYGAALAATWGLLNEKLAKAEREGGGKVVDFGIKALEARLHAQRPEDLAPCLAPAATAPLLLPAHVDLLCQTSPLPQIEPDVGSYLHGRDRGPPEVHVVWRADLDEGDTSRWVETVALCPPNSVESVTVPLHRLRRWLGEVPSEDDDVGDIEGACDRGTSDSQHQARVRPVLLWQGRDHTRVCGVAELRPNDVVVLPAAYGMAGLAQSEPFQALGEDQIDIWEPSHELSGKPVAVRLHRALLKPWLGCPPLRTLVELAEAPEWEKEELQDAIKAVLDYVPHDDDDAPAPPPWWLELLRKARDNGHFECMQHPPGGLVVRARRAAQTLEEEEQDLFADDDDLLSAAGREVSLADHSDTVKRAVDQLASRCLPEEFRESLKVSALWHDVGKLDERFQVMLRQGDELAVSTGKPLAKSAAIPESLSRRRAIHDASGLPGNFRHEMLSCVLAERFLPDGKDPRRGDLLLHLIASHHGYGRPFAPVCNDPRPPPVRGEHDGIKIDMVSRASTPASHTLDSGVTQRFWRLTRRYGWWGLAYLEAILRLGDWYGSQRTITKASEENRTRARESSPSMNPGVVSKSIVLKALDGSNPLGFLAALGTLVVLHQAKWHGARLSWRRDGSVWQPQLTGLPKDDPECLSRVLAEVLTPRTVSADAIQECQVAERKVDKKRRDLRSKKEIKKMGLRGQEYKDAVERLEAEYEALRQKWLRARQLSVPSPELALGKNIDCTEPEYRDIVKPLLEKAGPDERPLLDILAAFCSTGCFAKNKDGKLAPTPFAFITGSGHQDFLDTAGRLLMKVKEAPERLQSALFDPWTYVDEGLSMRWDPVEDRRYALLDRDPTANDNKPRTVWMANLLAYRALILFPTVPARTGLATVGWVEQKSDDPFFTWPLWSVPLDPDSIRSLLLLPELYRESPERAILRARDIECVFRARRIKVGIGANFKFNFSPAREV